KALFLLVVFATNTAVGFACAVGVDMGGFNSPHHSEAEQPSEVHIHNDGKNHVHEKQISAVKTHVHEDGANHQHDIEPVKKVPVDGSNLLTKDNGGCCTNEVQEFQNLDKSISVNTSISVPVFMAIMRTYFDIDFSLAIKDFPVNYKYRFFYPPPPDILIAIQRFQI
ncbi:MAG: hypothetical protein K2X37_03405, partial [Chitinophagaceae bacterium]|nr:hypothetical protein [Chitinophagaceae bacterium]